MLTRRTLLQTFAVGGSALGLGAMWPRPSWAAADRSFIFCYFRGGWDTLMALDPRDPAVFTEERREQTRIEPAWDLLPENYGRQILQPAGSNIPLGPVCGALLPHIDRMTVVNGIAMDTVAHDVGRRYFITW
ncbi:MAG: twin-arginine translocation signal domain-containing protein, partial [Myxococcota bacterium]